MFLKIQAAVLLFTCTSMLGAATVPASSIGTVTSNGAIQVDGSTIQSNSTLFAGSVVQTSAVPSSVRLADGSQLVLNPDSRMTLYRDHAVLEQGLTMQRNAGKYAVIANGLKVSSETSNGTVLVDIQNRTHMEVAVRSGAADVRTPAGDLVARIEPGKALSFNTAPMGDTSSSSVKIAGVLRPVAGHFVLTDALSGVTFQLQGRNLAAYSGAPIQVIGMVSSVEPAVPGASRVVNVSEASPQDNNAGNNRDKAGSGIAPSAKYPFFHKKVDKSTVLFIVDISTVGVFAGLGAAGTFTSSPPVSIP